MINTKPTPDKTVVRVGFVNLVSATEGEVLVLPMVETNSQGVYVDAQVRTASVDVPTSPTLFVWDTEVADTLGIYNPTTGVFTIPFSGDFNFIFMYNTATVGSAKQLYSAAQLWNGNAWVPLEYSTRQVSVAQGIKAQSTFVSTNPFQAGAQLRFVTWASATGVTINTESPATGYTIPAARILLTGVKTI